MSDFLATFNNPEYNYSGGATGTQAAVPVKSFENSHTFDSISAITMVIDTNVLGLYDRETDLANAVQKNSTVDLKRGVYFWFRGRVVQKPTIRSDADGSVMIVTIHGKESVLADALCPLNGEYVWKLETTSKLLADMPLLKSSTYGAFNGDTLWPDITDPVGLKLYIHETLSNADTLDVNIGVGTYTVTYVNTGTKTFGCAENVPAEFTVGTRFKISGSTGNDDSGEDDQRYSVVSATWTGSRTEVVVNEVISSAVANGSIIQDNIILSATNQGFKPRGWVKIADGAGNEFLNYDGYDDADADGKYRLRNCNRGELESTAAAHLSGLDVIERIPKMIAPGNAILENDEAGGPVEWHEMRLDEEYGIDVHIGSFVLPNVSDGSYRGTYWVYDEDRVIGSHAINSVGADYVELPGDHRMETVGINGFIRGTKFEVLDTSSSNDGIYTVAAVIFVGGNTRLFPPFGDWPGAASTGGTVNNSFPVSLNDIVETICTADPEDGGAGISSGDLYLAASAITVNRYEYSSSKPQNAWDAIQALLKQYSLAGELKFWYNHHNNTYRLKLVVNTAVYFQLPFANRIDKEDGIEDLYSAVRVMYQDDQELNRNDGIRCWHRPAPGGVDEPVNYNRIKRDSPTHSYDTANEALFFAADNKGMDVTADGRTDSKLMMYFKHGVTKEQEFAHWWFEDGVVPGIINLKKIKVDFGLYRACESPWQPYHSEDQEVVLRFEGCADYNTVNHAGTWIDLGFRMRGKPTRNGPFATAKVEAFKDPKVNAIRIIFEFMPGPKEDNRYWGIIHNLTITADPNNYVYIQISDNEAHKGNPLYVQAPAAIRKMRGGIGSNGSAGAPKPLTLDIGAASKGAAISIGRDMLKTKLARYEMRKYEYNGDLPVKPELALTIGVDEDDDGASDYIGTIREYAVTYDFETGLNMMIALYDSETATVS